MAESVSHSGAPLFIPASGNKMELIGTIISAIAYGFLITLYTSCFRSLFKGRRKYFPQKRNFLLTYTTIMFFLSTFALGTNIFLLINTLFTADSDPPLNFVIMNTPYWVGVLTVLGADGLMMWRCIVLYQAVSRVVLVILLMFLSFASLAAFGLEFWLSSLGPMNIAPTIIDHQGFISTHAAVILSVSISIFVNILLAALISTRILYHQRSIQKSLGTAHGSLYTRITVMCVESCSLIAVVNLAYLVFTLRGKSAIAWIPLLLLPQVSVISPLSIVYRVAKGVDATTTFNVSNISNDGLHRFNADIRFITPISTSVSRGE